MPRATAPRATAPRTRRDRRLVRCDDSHIQQVAYPILFIYPLFAVVNMNSSDTGLRPSGEAYKSSLRLQTVMTDKDRRWDREVNPSTGGLVGRTQSRKESLAESYARPRWVFKLE